MRAFLFISLLLVATTTQSFAEFGRTQSKRRAIDLVRPHVVPRVCFIWYVNSQVGWAPIGATRRGKMGDTGCAHWVAHELGIKKGSVRCTKGYTVRVADIIRGKQKYSLKQARVGDLWENPTAHSHIGIVRDIRKNSSGKVVAAQVEHDSSQEERGVIKEWLTIGDFYRPRRRTTTPNTVKKTKQNKRQAIALILPHVVPRDCFIWYVNSKVGWAPIGATQRGKRGDNGCAHWVAHQIGIKQGLTCNKGYSVRTSDIVKGKSKHTLATAKVGDIWKTRSNSHAGIVRKLRRDSSGKVTAALVEHDSSTDEKGVVKQWVETGEFYR